MTVNEEDERGNDSADNFLVESGEEPPADCADGSGLCTVTPLPNLDVTKAVDPESGSTVLAGQELTYTLTFVNNGNAAGAVDYTDHLTGVLDDADVTGQPVASDEALAVSAIEDGQFQVTGELAANQTVTVTYTAVVRADGERGDDVLGNVVVETGEEPRPSALMVAMTARSTPFRTLRTGRPLRLTRLRWLRARC